MSLLTKASISNNIVSISGHHEPIANMADTMPNSAILASKPGDMNILESVLHISRNMATKKDVCETMNEMKMLIVKMRDIIDELDSEVAQLVHRVQILEAELVVFRDKIKNVEAMAAFVDKEQMDNYIISITKLTEERLVSRINVIEQKYNGRGRPNIPIVYSKGKDFDGRKRGNVVMFEGIPLESDPVEIMKELASVLEVPNISETKINYVKRWISGEGTFEPKVLMKIGFTNGHDKDMFISKATKKKLNDLEPSARFFGVKIYPDRSYAERVYFKFLLNEVNKKNEDLKFGGEQRYIWVVSRGRVIKVINKKCGRFGA